MTLKMFTVRPLETADLAAIARLCEGRNVHADEYARFLALEGAFGLAAESEGIMLGAVTAIRYFEHGCLGPVLLQNGEAPGVTAILLARAVEILQKSGVTRVEAEASLGDAPILAGMGFVELGRMLVIEREAGPVDAPADTTRRMEAADLLDVGVIDAAAVGHGRKGYIAALRADLPEGARVTVGADGEVDGFVLLRRARRGHHLGPLVTSGDVDVAGALLDAAVTHAASGPLVALVPAGTQLAPRLARHGFEQVAELVHMRAGEPAAPDARARGTQWALGGRMTG